jgi:hypothetical protein
MEKMTHEARELALATENDGELYRRLLAPLYRRASVAYKAGDYDHAREAAKAYARVHCARESDWRNVFSVADRKQAAAYWAESCRDELPLLTWPE